MTEVSIIVESNCAQVNLWGLDAIKTKGESVAVALYMVGARPVREGTGRIARCASQWSRDEPKPSLLL